MKKAQLKAKIDGEWVVIAETDIDNSIPCSFSNIKDDSEFTLTFKPDENGMIDLGNNDLIHVDDFIKAYDNA